MSAWIHGHPLFLAGILWAANLAAQDFTISTVAGGVPPPTPALAGETSIGSPYGVAVDAALNQYFSSSIHCVFKEDRNARLTLVAGNGRVGFSGDGGPATAAQLNRPRGIAVDGAGNLYIADMANHRIRRVSTAGIITTVAGTGAFGFSGDGGPATSAQLNSPEGVAVDGAGNLYIADSGNHRVRRVSVSGTITTLAGTGEAGSSGDGGAATSARLTLPLGLAWDNAKGTLYIGDAGNSTLRYILPSGVINKVASAPATVIRGIAVDAASNVLFTGSSATVHQVYRLTPAGDTSVLAGAGPPGFSGDGRSPDSAQLSSPNGIAVDAEGQIYIADGNNRRVRAVLAAMPVIITTAGDGTDNYSGDNGPAVSAQIGLVADVALDSAGNLYIAESAGHRVRRVTPQGVISTVAGKGTDGSSGDGGAATAAELRAPAGVAVDAAGNLYIADIAAHCVRRVSPGGIITTFAGTGAYGYSGDGGPAASARLWLPGPLAVDRAGNLYIADGNNYRIRRVSPATATSPALITTVAGTGTSGYSGDGGPATSARLDRPNGLAVDAQGNLYISQLQRVRRVSAAGIITTVAGTGECCYSGDGGPATLARLGSPIALTVDGEGSLFIADAQNNRVRRVSPAGIITTVAGSGSFGYSGDGGPAAAAQLSAPEGLAADEAGAIYIGIQDYAVRKLTRAACQIGASPAALTFSAAGGPLTLNIQAAAGCAWSIAGLPAWITASAISGTGSAGVTLNAATNSGGARSATLTAAGTSVSVSQAAGSGACAFALSPAGQGFSRMGGSGSISVSTTSGCAWTATSPVSWVNISSGASGSGSGTVTFQASPNATSMFRSATLNVAGLPFTVEELGPDPPGLVSVGTMAQVASAGTWKTTFTLFNNGSGAALARLNFTGGDGTALVLPLTFPQTGLGPILASTVERILNAGEVLVLESEGPETQAALQGWARLLSSGTVTGSAVFRQRIGEREQEAVVPLEARTSANYVLVFDNTNGIDTGVAVASIGSQGGALTVVIKDDAGAHIQTSALNLALNGHRAFVVHAEYPATAGRRGTIEFRAPAGGQISVLGLRFNRGPFTTIPVWPR